MSDGNIVVLVVANTDFPEKNQRTRLWCVFFLRRGWRQEAVEVCSCRCVETCLIFCFWERGIRICEGEGWGEIFWKSNLDGLDKLESLESLEGLEDLDFPENLPQSNYTTGQPFFVSRSSVITPSEPSKFSAERIMPWLSIPRILRGGKLAMKQICLPTSSSGA